MTIEVRCDICGQTLPSGTPYVDYIEMKRRSRPAYNYYDHIVKTKKTQSYLDANFFAMDLCPACSEQIRDYIQKMRLQPRATVEMDKELKHGYETAIEEMKDDSMVYCGWDKEIKHGYETAIEEIKETARRNNELREAIRDTRPGGREH